MYFAIQKLLSEISEPNGLSIAAEIAEEVPYWNEGSIGICTIGLAILTAWLCWFGGFGALRRAPLRRNRMSPLAPAVLVGAWLLLMAGIGVSIQAIFEDSSQALREVVSYLLIFVLNAGIVAAILWIAHQTFARRLKGFGLDGRTLVKDTVFACVNLVAVYALVIILLWVVMEAGELFKPEFSLEEHQTLTLLGETEALWIRVVTAFFAVIVAPVFEELLFRGIMQTSLRSLTSRPWLAIVLTSLFFSVLHPLTHAPALFALSCGLGYAYERSGSLLRPIIIHILFNGLSVAGTLFAAA